MKLHDWLAMSEPHRGESNGPDRDRTDDLVNAIHALSQTELRALRVSILVDSSVECKMLKRISSFSSLMLLI
jgi:hypothetical protein